MGTRIRPKLVIPEPSGPQDISTDPTHEIVFKHPGYPDLSNDLITLPAYDRPNGGFDRDTASTLCGILAGNRWNGFFTEERGGLKVNVDILNASTYYYYLQSSAGKHSGFGKTLFKLLIQYYRRHRLLVPCDSYLQRMGLSSQEPSALMAVLRPIHTCHNKERYHIGAWATRFFQMSNERLYRSLREGSYPTCARERVVPREPDGRLYFQQEMGGNTRRQRR